MGRVWFIVLKRFVKVHKWPLATSALAMWCIASSTHTRAWERDYVWLADQHGSGSLHVCHFTVPNVILFNICTQKQLWRSWLICSTDKQYWNNTINNKLCCVATLCEIVVALKCSWEWLLEGDHGAGPAGHDGLQDCWVARKFLLPERDKKEWNMIIAAKMTMANLLVKSYIRTCFY